MEDLQFKKNRKSVRREIMKAIMVVILAILIFVIQSDQLTMVIISAGLVILGFYLIYNSLKNKNTVIVNKRGILSSTNGMSLIKWEYIEGFEIKKAVNTEVLVVTVNDIDTLLSEMNRISKQLMKTNIKKLGSPVIIPKSEFNDSLTEAKAKIEKYKNSL